MWRPPAQATASSTIAMTFREEPASLVVSTAAASSGAAARSWGAARPTAARFSRMVRTRASLRIWRPSGPPTQNEAGRFGHVRISKPPATGPVGPRPGVIPPRRRRSTRRPLGWSRRGLSRQPHTSGTGSNDLQLQAPRHPGGVRGGRRVPRDQARSRREVRRLDGRARGVSLRGGMLTAHLVARGAGLRCRVRAPGGAVRRPGTEPRRRTAVRAGPPPPANGCSAGPARPTNSRSGRSGGAGERPLGQACRAASPHEAAGAVPDRNRP